MADSHDDAIIEAPKKNKGGRPKKGPDMAQVVKDLQDQIANMQKAALANQAHQADRFEQMQQKATLDPIPVASEVQPPGSYVKLGIDASGAPIMGKVRWTKEIIENTYPPVTFVPMRDFTCGPHGILYRVEPGIETTVPSIVKDLYDGAIKTEKQEWDKYKPMSPTEHAELTARAQETPGTGHRSRLARVGAGLNVHGSDTPAVETPAQ